MAYPPAWLQTELANVTEPYDGLREVGPDEIVIGGLSDEVAKMFSVKSVLYTRLKLKVDEFRACVQCNTEAPPTEVHRVMFELNRLIIVELLIKDALYEQFASCFAEEDSGIGVRKGRILVQESAQTPRLVQDLLGLDMVFRM